MASNNRDTDPDDVVNLNAQLRKLPGKGGGGLANGGTQRPKVILKDCSCCASKVNIKPIMQASKIPAKSPSLISVKPGNTSTASDSVTASKGKIETAEPTVVPGTSSRTASSELEDEPFGMASRWTAEEKEGKRMVRNGLAEDGEDGWQEDD